MNRIDPDSNFKFQNELVQNWILWLSTKKNQRTKLRNVFWFILCIVSWVLLWELIVLCLLVSCETTFQLSYRSQLFLHYVEAISCCHLTLVFSTTHNLYRWPINDSVGNKCECEINLYLSIWVSPQESMLSEK